MRARGVQCDGRGVIRGLFLFGVVATLGLACEREKPAPTAPAADAGAKQVPQPPPASADAGAADAAKPLAVPAPPAAFAPPWTTLAPPWEELKKSLAGVEAGKMSGEAWGTDTVVRGIVRAQCGSGAMLQAVFESKDGFGVTPAMPLRFFGLQTGKAVTYTENNLFTVTVNFSEDTPERLAGSLRITYEEHGKDKTFIDLTVDAKPMPMLLEPRLQGKGNLPEFPACHPSGRFYAKTADGRTALGFLNATVSEDGAVVVMTPLLSPQTGIRVVAMSREGLREPWTLDLGRDAEGAPARMLVTAFYTPELTSPSTAEGGNIGTEQVVTVRQGQATIQYARGKRPEVKIRMEELRIPELLEGPLRGTTFSEFVIEAVGHPGDVYPGAPPAEPLVPTE